MSNNEGTDTTKGIGEDVQRAVTLIRGLTAPREQRHAEMPLGTERMPRNELHHCAGLAFLFTTKGGIVLSVESGHGFVLQKLPSSTGKTWSAPLFFKSYGSSVGLTLGVSKVDAVIVLDTPEAVAAFHQRSQASLAADVNFSFGDKVGVSMPATAVDLVHPQLTGNTFVYSATKGLMLVDSSIKGIGYRVNNALNQAIYGDIAAVDVLGGTAQPPEAFQPLYELLESLAPGR